MRRCANDYGVLSPICNYAVTSATGGDDSRRANGGEDDEPSRRHFICDPTRLILLQQILAHPDGVLSVEELAYQNPDDIAAAIRDRLQDLTERGIVEEHDVAQSDAIQNPPTTFYSISETGIRLLKAVNRYEEVAVWRSVYDRMERTARIDALEALETRPVVDYGERGESDGALSY